MADGTVAEVMAELSALEDPKARAVNEKHGNDRAGWALTTERVAKSPEGLDLAALLDVIEAEMRNAPDRLQWATNHCLAQIGIEHVELNQQALAEHMKVNQARISKI